MTTMGKTIDRVPEVDVSGKIDQIADLVRQRLRKAVKDGNIDPQMLQCINEHGGLFQEAILPIAIKIGSIGRLIDSALLEPITTIAVPAIETFIAGAKFALGETDGVKIGWLGDNFKTNFGTKTENGVTAQNLRIHRLRKYSVDAPIIAELGGEELIETNLATMWEMMKKQGHGEQGDLLVNGYANIFYIRDSAGALWAVDCSWYSFNGDWNVHAYPVANPYRWIEGDQVFSR